MRILLSAYNCRPHRGSEFAIGWNWTVELSRLGHSVHVLTHAGNREEIEAEIAKNPLPNVEFSYLDAPSWAMKIGLGTMRLRYLMWLWVALKRARELEQEIDLCHHVSWNTFEGGSLLWRLRRPFFLGPVGGGQRAPAAFSSYFGKSWKSEWIRNQRVRFLARVNPFVRLALRRAKLVMASNSETLETVTSAGCVNSRLIWEACIPNSYAPSRPTRGNVVECMRVLWVGGLMPRKSLRLALEALAASSGPNRLTVVGDGPLARELPGWLKRLGLEDRVDWWGQVPWLEVKRAYLENDVLLFTSLRDTSGAQFLEAMAHGMPVIALDHHGAHDWIPDDAGIKVPVTNPKETIAGLASAIDRLWREPELREQMGINAYEYAKKQTWENRVREIAALYEKYM
ncbi:MAG: Alpha-D-kanosaminyltransferase [Candidatus Latescibacteria bacterium ADurb.Bin168]|nr:MAG: Alpha-D-kanosaminyltransferase [Candidatus Latescibacteria bacterium ADurb.Bin168]